MKKPIDLNRPKKVIFAAIAIFLFVCTANVVAIAQDKYKIGDRVECDATQMGTFKKGTIVPFPKNDPDQDGRFYYVKIDGSHMDEGYLCMATHMRRLEQAKSSDRDSGRDPDSGQTQSQFSPGDRVQCDAAQIGQWKAGTVMHFLQTDRYRDANGGYFRVRLDAPNKNAFDAGGQVCMARFIRPFNDGHKETAPNTKRNIGDRIEAQTYAGNWLPATIMAKVGEFFTVRYDNYDSKHDETVDAVRLRTAGGTPAVKPTEKANADLPPLLDGTMPPISGTAWKMDFGIKRANVQRILFCKSGRWEVVSSQLLTGGAASLMGTYSVSGGNLSLKSDGKTTPYRMSSNGGFLQLTGGKQNMRLYEPVPTECK